MLVLVAGGAGFIGWHLCERLLRDGHSVICIDNLITGRRRNIEPFLDCGTFTFVEHDVVEELPPLPPVERIFHLASPASPPAYQCHAVETLRVNSEGTCRLLEVAVRDGAPFLYASMSEVYGDPLEHPQRENYRGKVSPVGPRSMYDEAKRYGEAPVLLELPEHHTGSTITLRRAERRRLAGWRSLERMAPVGRLRCATTTRRSCSGLRHRAWWGQSAQSSGSAR